MADDLLRRLRHDIGKYVTFNQRFLGDSGDAVAAREALVDDLLHTHRGPAGPVPVAAIWAALRPELEAAWPGDPHLVALDAEMAALAEVAAALRVGSDTAADVQRGREAAARVSELCRAWARAGGA